jgi:hypothetical protein
MLDHGNATDPGVFDVCREPTHLKDKARNIGLLEPAPPPPPPPLRPPSPAAQACSDVDGPSAAIVATASTSNAEVIDLVDDEEGAGATAAAGGSGGNSPVRGQGHVPSSSGSAPHRLPQGQAALEVAGMKLAGGPSDWLVE